MSVAGHTSVLLFAAFVSGLMMACGASGPITAEEYFDKLESIAARDADRGVASTRQCEGFAGLVGTSSVSLNGAAADCLADWQLGVGTTRAELNSLSPPVALERPHNDLVKIYDEATALDNQITQVRLADNFEAFRDAIVGFTGVWWGAGSRTEEACQALQNAANEAYDGFGCEFREWPVFIPGFLNPSGASSDATPSGASPGPTPPVVSGEETTTESGLTVITIEEGTGASPVLGDEVLVNYSSWTEADGRQYTSTYELGEPDTFTLTEGRLLDGLIEGFALMKEGGVARLIIPSDLAYAERGIPGGPVPPNATLIFDIQLIEVRRAGEASSPTATP